MAKELYLYKGYTPNLGQGEHLLVNSFAGLVTEMAAYRQQTVQLDNYRINSGIAQVKPTSSLKDYLTMSYAIEYDTVGKFGRAYFIKSAQPRESWIDYELELDHWGTFMHDASIQDLIIHRTNRNIGTGVYDKIEASDVKSVTAYNTTPAWTIANLCIAFLVNETVKVSNLSVLTDQKVTRQKIYITGINTSLSAPIDNINLTIARVQNIYERDIALNWNPEIQLVRAWIIPLAAVYASSPTPDVTLKYVDPSTGTDTNTLSCYELRTYRKDFSMAITTDPDYQYFAGTSTHGIELTNLCVEQHFDYEFITKTDGIQVMLRNEDNLMDITQAFEIGLTINEGQITGLQKITNAVSTLGSVAAIGATVAGAAAPGVGLLAGASLVGSAAQRVQSLSSKAPTRHTGYGDALITFGPETGTTWTLTSPFRVVTYKSLRSENAHARAKGAVFDIPYASLTALKSATLLGTGSNTDNTYVEADCDVMNIQADAADVIREKLHNGIYLWDRTT